MTVAAGNPTEIQFNTAGNLDASPSLTWDNSSNTLQIGNGISNAYVSSNTDTLLWSGKSGGSTGGSVTIRGGLGNMSGGTISIIGGDSSQTGDPGQSNVIGGVSFSSINPGGAANVSGGTSHVSNGGNVSISGGRTESDTHSSGHVFISTPYADMGSNKSSGSVEILTGLVYGGTAGNILFKPAAVERIRITNTGQLLIGTSTPHGVSTNSLLEIKASTSGLSPRAFTMSTDSGVQFIGEFWNKSTGNGNFVRFGTGTSFTPRGSITYSNNVTNYNTTSDERMKTDIEDAPEASSIIDGIKVRSFKWKQNNKKTNHWLVAQELNTIAPIAVSPGSATEPWQIDPSKLVPVLIKELQDVRKRLAKAEEILQKLNK